MASQQEESSRVWTLVGLGLALLSLPIMIAHFLADFVPNIILPALTRG